MLNKKTNVYEEGTKLTNRQREAAINALERAADKLRTVGWGVDREITRKDNSKKIVGYCSVGALKAVRAPKAAYLALAMYLNKRVHEDLYFIDNDLDFAEEVIIDYNDDVAQGRGDVLRAFKGACTALRNKKI